MCSIKISFSTFFNGMTRAKKGVCDRVSVRKYYTMISATNKIKKILKLSTTTRKCLSLCDDFKIQIVSELFS